MSAIVKVDRISFRYSSQLEDKPILQDLSFEVKPGEFLAIRGPSGSGKSTLLYLLGNMNQFQSGSIEVLGFDLKNMSDEQAAHFRNQKIGFVFQQFHLLPKLTISENILLPSEYSENKDNQSQKLLELAQFLSIESILYKYPNQVSGGQQQRAAIARALLNDPELILADEPTGNLDSENAGRIIHELKRLQQLGKTIILITHDHEVASQADRVIHLQDGRVVREEVNHVIVAAKESNFSTSLHHINSKKNLMMSLKNSWIQIRQNKIRSILNMIGISIGISAVLTMMTIGQFAKTEILASYAELGVNTVSFQGYPNWNAKASDSFNQVYRSFSWEKDILPLKKIFPEVIRVSPELRTWESKAFYAGREIENNVRVFGVSDETIQITQQKLLAGQFVNSFHVESKSDVCVIGFEIAQRLFLNINPLGEVLTYSDGDKNHACRVIGIMKTRATRNEWRKPDLEIYVPFTYFQAKSTNWWATEIKEVLLELKPGSSIEKVGKSIQRFFESKYGNSGRFRVDSDSILISQMTQFLNIFSFFLIIVALISLAVGGIGIANMMLVSVNERYKEIGLRKALGATPQNIRDQFLNESILICVLAGMIGLFLGIGACQLILWGATKLIPKLEYQFLWNFWAILFSMTSILIVGFLSGITPAKRAEKLTPMQALRSD